MHHIYSIRAMRLCATAVVVLLSATLPLLGSCALIPPEAPPPFQYLDIRLVQSRADDVAVCYSTTTLAVGLRNTSDRAIKHIHIEFYLCDQGGLKLPEADRNVISTGKDVDFPAGADLKDSGLRVVALIDRSPHYDTSNGDWTGTRLYEIENDPAGLNSLLVSKKLPSPELGLTAGAADVAAAVVEEYQGAHHTIPDASIAAFDLAHVASVYAALDALSDALYTATSSAAARDAVRDVILCEVEDFYATSGDLSIDLGDLGRVITQELDMADAEATALEGAVRAAVLHKWHGEANPHGTGVSVHYVPLSSAGVPEVHHDSYFQGRSTAHPLDFVADSSWVPGSSGGGLLYRLWYEELD